MMGGGRGRIRGCCRLCGRLFELGGGLWAMRAGLGVWGSFAPGCALPWGALPLALRPAMLCGMTCLPYGEQCQCRGFATICGTATAGKYSLNGYMELPLAS